MVTSKFAWRELEQVRIFSFFRVYKGKMRVYKGTMRVYKGEMRVPEGKNDEGIYYRVTLIARAHR